MIRITTVLGDVLVDDRKTGRSQMAHSGMTLDAMGDYLIEIGRASCRERV